MRFIPVRLLSVVLVFGLIGALGACSSTLPRPKVEAYDSARDFAAANALYDNKMWADARQKFLSVKLKDNSGKYAPLAQLRVADTYFQEDEPEKAVDEYRSFLEVYPSDRYAYYAQYQIATIYYDQIKGEDRAYALAERALGEFKKLNENYPRNPDHEIVEGKIARCRTLRADHEYMVAKYDFDRAGYTGAADRALNVYEYYPENPNVPEALYIVVASCKRTGQKDKAQKYYEVLKDKYPDKPATARAAAELASPDPKAAPAAQPKKK